MKKIWKILLGISLIVAVTPIAMPDQTIRFLAETSVGNVPTLGVSRIFTTGAVYYVDSNNGSATNAGTTPDAALDSLASALAVATANTGDVILFMPGHAETISANTELTTEGITLKGLGNGDNRPVFTFDTATTANLEIKADNITIDGLIFKNDIDNQASIIESISAYTVIENCEFYEGSSKQFLEGILFSNANCNHCKVLNCRFIQATDGGDNAITIGAALDDLEIAGCRIHGDWDDAGIHNPTGNVATRLVIHDNIISNVATGQHAIELVSACTGELYNNMLYSDALATVLDPGSLKPAANFANIAVDTGSIEVPQTGSQLDFIGTDDSNNNAATTNVAANNDGSILERLEGLLGLVSADPNSAVTSDLHGKIGTDAEMADSSLYDMIGSTTGTTTDSLNGKIGTDTEMADNSLYDLLGAGCKTLALSTAIGSSVDGTTTDSLHGKIGTDTEMGDVSLYDMWKTGTATGTTDIDISEAVYTGYVAILTVTAPASGLRMCRIDIDVNKATTGLDTIATAADTFDAVLVGKIDGTNYRTLINATQITANGDGSLEASESGWSFEVGPLAAAEVLQVMVKLSAERDDAELPYRVTYTGMAPTITPVAAG